MAYQIKCDKCGHILMEGTGNSVCFMGAGSKIGCKKCGNNMVLTEAMLLMSSKLDKTSEKPKGIKLEV